MYAYIIRALLFFAKFIRSTKFSLKIGVIGLIGGGFTGYGMYLIGYPGDVLDITNHRIVSGKAFAKKYQLVD